MRRKSLICGQMLGINEGVLGKGFFVFWNGGDLPGPFHDGGRWFRWSEGRAATSEPPWRIGRPRSGRRMQGWFGGGFIDVGSVEFGGVVDRRRGEFRREILARELMRRHAA
jgi:hypothetical protein